MRFQRLLLESAGATVTVDLHPRLTVVAGVGELERESLVTELLELTKRELGGGR